MGLDVLHPLSMLVHELIEAVLSRTVGGYCQGCSLRLTGTRGLVVEGGVERVVDAFWS